MNNVYIISTTDNKTTDLITAPNVVTACRVFKERYNLTATEYKTTKTALKF